MLIQFSNKQSGLILDIGAWVRFIRHTFVKKGICLFITPKLLSFLTISYENIFFKTKDTRLGAIIAPNKDLLE